MYKISVFFFSPSSILDPERWNIEKKKSDTPTENGSRTGDGPEHRRRPGDPRERLRKENDGIVLSPQRRSFNSGCFVPLRVTAHATRSHSPLSGKNEPSHVGKPPPIAFERIKRKLFFLVLPHSNLIWIKWNLGVREIQTGTRRIGSGRILRDSWDFSEKSEQADNDFGFRGQQQRNNEREEKYERRSFGRDFEITRDKENNTKEGGRRNGRFERRRISDREQEEPEW